MYETPALAGDCLQDIIKLRHHREKVTFLTTKAGSNECETKSSNMTKNGRSQAVELESMAIDRREFCPDV